MAQQKRRPAEQSRHDQFVARSAGQHRAHGQSVKADIPGYERPPVLSGYRPDVVVTERGRIKKIIEVETPGSLRTDTKQQNALRRAAERVGADFELKVAKRRSKK